MPGPAPRGPGKTRRRNTEVWVTLPAAGRQEPPPALPGVRPWLPTTVEWWNAIWASPMATQWSASDIPTLQRLAALVDGALFDPDPRAGAEIRQLEDRFGLSPQARLKLRWVIADQAADAETEADGAAAAAAGGTTRPLASGDASRSTTVAGDASRPDPRRLRALPGGA